MKYRISAPVRVYYDGRQLDLQRALHELTRTGTSRVILIAPDIRNPVNLDEKLTELSRCIDFFAEKGLESGVWIGHTIGHGMGARQHSGFSPIINLRGQAEATTACPLDDTFRQVICDGVRKIASAGARLILIDDDFRLGGRSGTVGCFCERHIARFCRETDLLLTREQIVEKVYTGGPGTIRDTWLRLAGDSLALLARQMRQAVDTVDPQIRLGLCACTSTWDLDGIDAGELCRIMAGGTKPLLRLIGAPYWTDSKSRPLATVIELERLERSWLGDDIEIISEGDTYPRPRYQTPAALLEGFDTALRADGRLDGILKYMFDYVSSFDYETRYADLTEKNQALYAEIDRLFAAKKSVGINVVRKMKNLAAAELPDPVDSAYLTSQFVFPPAIRFLTDNSLPVTYDHPSCPSIIFGEDARQVDLSLLQNGVILDAVAAGLLTQRGVDVGVSDIRPITGVSQEHDLQDNEFVQVNGHFYAIQPHTRARILSRLIMAETEICGACLYENAAGMRFLVYPFNAYESQQAVGACRNYCRQRQLAAGLAWLAKKPFEVLCLGHPDLYLMAKTDDNSLSVGLWNFSPDEIEQPCLLLGNHYTSVELINCKYACTLSGKQLQIHGTMMPYAFIGVCLHKNGGISQCS